MAGYTYQTLGGPVTLPAPPEHLVEAVDAFLAWAAALPEDNVRGCDWRKLADDPGSRGYGLCCEAAADLYEYLRDERGLAAKMSDFRLVGVRVTDLYGSRPPPDEAYHYVAMAGGWAIDLTARQFNDRLPFPFFYPADLLPELDS